MKITIISVGKKHEENLKGAIDEYTTRISRVISVEWQFIVPSGKPEQTARKEESEQIINKLKPSDIVWLLDERGEELSSITLASKIGVMQSHSVPNLVFVIGGSYGVSENLRNQVNFVWSLSKLVFPHQLVRLVLAEQLYRSTEINRGSGYHHA